MCSSDLGARVSMLGAVGEDVFGETLRGVLKAERVDASGVKAMRGETTGVAVIQVAQGDNAITGAAGANALFSPKMVVRTPRRGEIWVAQFETPVATTAMLFAKARAAGARTILNLAPMVPFPARLMKLVDIAILNEIELAQATGAKITAKSSVAAIAAACRKLGAPVTIATLGSRGLVIVTPDGVTALPAHKAKVVDTTGAGDRKSTRLNSSHT